MKRRGRSILKWACTAATVVLLVVWVGSAWWNAGFKGRVLIVFVGRGVVRLSVYDSRTEGRYWLAPERHSQTFRWWFHFSDSLRMKVVDLPIWGIALLAAAPGAYLWLRDRHRLPGHCAKCGYDLRGANHAVCPECGAAAPGEASLRRGSGQAAES